MIMNSGAAMDLAFKKDDLLLALEKDSRVGKAT